MEELIDLGTVNASGVSPEVSQEVEDTAVEFSKRTEASVRTIENDYQFYQPLDPTQRQIRILVLKPEPYGSTAELFCQLRVVSLKEVGKKYQFECLSYCWGDLNDTVTIKLLYYGLIRETPEGRLQNVWSDFKITRSLHEALCQYRAQGAEFNTQVYVWADAVCINQSDVVEKSAQVAMMGDIYASAGHTTIWLGVGDQYTNHAMDFGLLLSRKERDDDAISRWRTSGRKLAGIEASRIDGIIGKTMSLTEEEMSSTGFLPMRKSIQTLFSRPWFRRVWVLQEQFLSSDIAVQCGEKQVPWISLLMLNAFESRARESQGKLMWTKPELVELAPGLTAYKYIMDENVNHHISDAWFTLSVYQESTEKVPLSVLIWELEKFGATDPHDQVFALLGIAKETQNVEITPRGFRPDYSRSIEDTYTSFTKAMINHERRLDLLSLVNTFDAEETRLRCPGLPSWVPEFGKTFERQRAFGYMAWRLYDACAGRKAQLQDQNVDDCSPVLSLRGRIIDLVTLPGSAKDDETFLYVLVSENDRECPQLTLNLDIFAADGLQKLWSEHVAPLNTYVTGEDLLTAFIVTLLAGRTNYENTIVRDDPRVYLLDLQQIPGLIAHFAAFWMLKDPDLALLPDSCAFYASKKELLAMSETGVAREFGKRLLWTCHNRSFLVTKKGLIGLCPKDTQAGDVIAVLDGGLVPYVLRPLGVSEAGHYELVGECYVHGRMHGTSFFGGEDEVEHDFQIY